MSCGTRYCRVLQAVILGWLQRRNEASWGSRACRRNDKLWLQTGVSGVRGFEWFHPELQEQESLCVLDGWDLRTESAFYTAQSGESGYDDLLNLISVSESASLKARNLINVCCWCHKFHHAYCAWCLVLTMLCFCVSATSLPGNQHHHQCYTSGSYQEARPGDYNLPYVKHMIIAQHYCPWQDVFTLDTIS